MNPIKKLSAETPVGPIQYSHALSANHNETEPTLPLVRTKTFRVRFAPPNHEARLRMTERDRTSGKPAPARATDARHGAMRPNKEQLIEAFEFMPEPLQRRSRAKTFVMEQALQRSEWSQRRFWGINE